MHDSQLEEPLINVNILEKRQYRQIRRSSKCFGYDSESSTEDLIMRGRQMSELCNRGTALRNGITDRESLN